MDFLWILYGFSYDFPMIQTLLKPILCQNTEKHRGKILAKDGLPRQLVDPVRGHFCLDVLIFCVFLLS